MMHLSHYFDRGSQNVVVSFGCGGAGALGTGSCADSFTPVKALMSKCEPVVEISAGTTWSLARTGNGSLYAWGKGLRGQLGLGSGRRYSLVPEKVECFGSFVKMDGTGHAHNIGIVTPMKHLNERTQTILAQQRSADMSEGVLTNGLSDALPVRRDIHMNVDVTLKKSSSASLHAFDCCKRHIGHERSHLRYQCEDCLISSICHTCAKICHAGHRLVSSDVEHTRSKTVRSRPNPQPRLDGKIPRRKDRLLPPISRMAMVSTTCGSNLTSTPASHSISTDPSAIPSFSRPSRRKTLSCRCGLFNPHCRSLPTIAEVYDDEGVVKGMIAVRRSIAVRVIQRTCRKYVCRKRAEKAARDLIPLRRAAAADYYEYTVLASVWQKVHYGAEVRSQCIETAGMEGEEDATRRWEHMRKLQIAVSSMDALSYAIRRLLGTLSICLPRLAKKITVAVGTSRAGTHRSSGDISRSSSHPVDSELHPLTPTTVLNSRHPTYAFSWISVREQQLLLSPSRRVPSEILTVAAARFPLFHRHEGAAIDGDVNSFLRVHLRDVQSEVTRHRAAEKVKVKTLRAARAVVLKRQLAIAERSDKAALFKRAAAITDGTSLITIDHTLSLQALRAKVAADKTAVRLAEDTAVLIREREEDSTFEQLYHTNSSNDRNDYNNSSRKSKNVKSNAIDLHDSSTHTHTHTSLFTRRNSISDPSHMYSRVLTAIESLAQRSAAQRRPSLPSCVCAATLVPAEHSLEGRSRVEGVTRSLSMFRRRLRLLHQFTDARHEAAWKAMKSSARLSEVKKNMSLAWLNPRIPCEKLHVLIDKKRRRTIAEPERLRRQLLIMFETRRAFSELRKITREKDKLFQRRRSFDYGEEQDNKKQINTSLDYVFELPYSESSIVSLLSDSDEMGARMLLSGFDFTPVVRRKIKEQPVCQQSMEIAVDNVQPNSTHNVTSPGGSAHVQMSVPVSIPMSAPVAESDTSPTHSGIAASAPTAISIALEAKERERAKLYAARNRVVLQHDAKRFIRYRPSTTSTSSSSVVNVPRNDGGEAVVVWEEHFDDDGHPYYFRRDTGESSWGVSSSHAHIERQLQDGDGNWYWYNGSTSQIRWL